LRERVAVLEAEVKVHSARAEALAAAAAIGVRAAASDAAATTTGAAAAAAAPAPVALTAEVSALQEQVSSLASQVAEVSLSHVSCPGHISRLEAEASTARRTLEAAKVDFAQWRSHVEGQLALERDRAGYAVEKLAAFQGEAAEARAQMREEHENTLAVLREQARKYEGHIVRLVEQLDRAGQSPLPPPGPEDEGEAKSHSAVAAAGGTVRFSMFESRRQT
jgi:chromosome segregation ATPase